MFFTKLYYISAGQGSKASLILKKIQGYWTSAYITRDQVLSKRMERRESGKKEDWRERTGGRGQEREDWRERERGRDETLRPRPHKEDCKRKR